MDGRALRILHETDPHVQNSTQEPSTARGKKQPQRLALDIGPTNLCCEQEGHEESVSFFVNSPGDVCGAILSLGHTPAVREPRQIARPNHGSSVGDSIYTPVSFVYL